MDLVTLYAIATVAAPRVVTTQVPTYASPTRGAIAGPIRRRSFGAAPSSTRCAGLSGMRFRASRLSQGVPSPQARMAHLPVARGTGACYYRQSAQVLEAVSLPRPGRGEGSPTNCLLLFGAPERAKNNRSTHSSKRTPAWNKGTASR